MKYLTRKLMEQKKSIYNERFPGTGLSLKIFILPLLLLSTTLFWQSCSPPTSDSSGITILIPARTETITEEDLAADTEVYFLFTNISTEGNATNSPVINSDNAYPVSTPSRSSSISISYLSDSRESDLEKEIREFNEQPIVKSSSIKTLFTKSLSLESPLADATEVPDDSVGAEKDFYSDVDATEDTKIPATCRLVRPVGDQTLAIWVADDCWTGYTLPDGVVARNRIMTQEMVDAAANKFLISESNNDIFDWDTTLFGEPYKDLGYSNLIDGDNTNHITILFYDIADDNSSSGGVLGYFFAKDFYLKSSYSGSNERTMFYIDAVLFANQNDDGFSEDTGLPWELTDFWPDKIIGTLAHEFQHMINWTANINHRNSAMVNEMCSLMAEDFLAEKLNITGPRYFVDVDNISLPNNTGGRLPDFNQDNDGSLVVWTSESYGLAYGFGAFLARKYGGAPLFQKIVQNNYSDLESVIQAVNTENGTSLSLQDILIAWGKDVILSNLAGSAYQNGVSARSSKVGGIEYNLGPIDLYRYENGGIDGPKFYTYLIDSIPVPKAASNTYVYMGTFSGNQSWTIDLPANVVLTVIKSTDTP